MTDDFLPRTREEAIAAAARAHAQAIANRDALSPRDAALAAYEPGGPSVDEIEARIRRQRGEGPPPTDTSPPTG